MKEQTLSRMLKHTQEMLAKGYLAATGVYVCTEHTEEIVAKYFLENNNTKAGIPKTPTGQCSDG